MKALLSCAALGLTSCASISSPPSLAPGAHYVAMGSSFAAGVGIGPLRPGSPERCGRTTNNYASLTAARFSLALDDHSCSGATTAHLLRGWDDLLPQLFGVRPDTRLVTITVGGNDLGYMGLLFAASCDPAAGLTVGNANRPCPAPPPLPGEADYAALEANLVQIARSVRAIAPAARVIFIQYVTLVPEQLCNATPISAEAAANARQLARRLAAVTASAAAAAGAEVLAADQLSASHTPCDADPFSNGFVVASARPGAPWHPTAEGHQAIAEALAAVLAN